MKDRQLLQDFVCAGAGEMGELRVVKQEPLGQIQLTLSSHVVHKLRMIFTVLNGWGWRG